MVAFGRRKFGAPAVPAAVERHPERRVRRPVEASTYWRDRARAFFAKRQRKRSRGNG